MAAGDDVCKLFSREQVSEHNDNNNSWLIIHNNVYDVTAFLNEHPGGEEVLLEQAGKDATENFEDVGHSSDAREMMKKYKIGELAHDERSNIPEKSEPNWNSETKSEETSMKSWLMPLILGLIATLLYKYLFGASTKTQ
uniref:Cytochrome b5 n=2 Tax=Glossina TaxID=44049 RepID=A0A1B0GBU5_GLOMM